jgi:hypothetical protein
VEKHAYQKPSEICIKTGKVNSSHISARREKPVQNGKIDVHGLELPTVKLQVSRSQAVLETVKFDEPAITKRNTKMLPTQVPCAFELEGIIQIEPFYFAW